MVNRNTLSSFIFQKLMTFPAPKSLVVSTVFYFYLCGPFSYYYDRVTINVEGTLDSINFEIKVYWTYRTFIDDHGLITTELIDEKKICFSGFSSVILLKRSPSQQIRVQTLYLPTSFVSVFKFV